MDRVPSHDFRETDTDTGTSGPPRPVRAIVEQLDAMSARDSLSIGEIISAFGHTSFLSTMLVPALLLVSPLSGIPLFSSICGLTIAIIAMQQVLRRDHLWLPRFVTRRRISGKALHRSAGVLNRVADWLDRNSAERLAFLVPPPLSVGAVLFCALAGMTIPLLEVVPFSSSLLGATVSLICVGLLVRDGVYVLGATAVAAIAALVPAFVVTQVVT